MAKGGFIETSKTDSWASCHPTHLGRYKSVQSFRLHESFIERKGNVVATSQFYPGRLKMMSSGNILQWPSQDLELMEVQSNMARNRGWATSLDNLTPCANTYLNRIPPTIHPSQNSQDWVWSQLSGVKTKGATFCRGRPLIHPVPECQRLSREPSRAFFSYPIWICQGWSLGLSACKLCITVDPTPLPARRVKQE